jgi:SAM-dependent methyltransferase
MVTYDPTPELFRVFRYVHPGVRTMNEAKLNEFVGRILTDLGGAFSVPLVRIGEHLGLYRALHESGPMTAEELAGKTRVAERYAREWLSQQAASGYVTYDPATSRFALPPEHAMVLVDEDSPVYLQPAFDLATVMMENQTLVEPAFRTGRGVGWGAQSQCLFCTTGRFFRPSYQNALVQSWLPALDGVVARLEQGASVADVGCGHGFSTIIMARAFPKSTFVGYDFHPGSIAEARTHAEQHGVTANTRFEVALASDYPGKAFDLVTFFDCLHDMGDPVGAARHVRQACAPGPEAGRALDGRRACGGRPAGRQSQPGQPALFRRVDHDLRAHLARSAGRRGARRTGGIRETVGGDRRRRF